MTSFPHKDDNAGPAMGVGEAPVLDGGLVGIDIAGGYTSCQGTATWRPSLAAVPDAAARH